MLTQLHAALITAATETADSIARKYGSAGIYGFALYTSGEYSYVIDSFSTQDGLTRVASKYLLEKSYQVVWGSLDVAVRELKWSPCDSPHHGEYEKNFKAANAELDAIWKAVDQDSDDAFLDTCRRIHEEFTAVLLAVRQSGVFPQSVLLNVLMGDQSNEERFLNAEPLNVKDVLDDFASELNYDPVQLKSLRTTRWNW